MDFIEVDGSHGEGGGQTLRTAVAFSVITKKPVRVSKVRAGREVPGLRRQHVSALKVLGEIFDCQLEGATEGSSSVSFVPGQPRLGSIEVDMGTAASITLVLQAVVPAVAVSRSSLSIILHGGTDVPWSPTFDYFETVVRPAYGAMGIAFTVDAARRGYYPKGGGIAKAMIRASGSIRPLKLATHHSVSSVDIVSRSASLPRHVAERQAASAVEFLEKKGLNVKHAGSSDHPSDSPGSSILISAVGEGFFIGADAIGSRGKPSEEVGKEAAEKMSSTIASGSCLDANLADMVGPLLTLATGQSEIRIPLVSSHLETGLYVAELFTGSRHEVAEQGSSSVLTVRPG